MKTRGSVDASALVKLFKPEHETEAFRTALADWPVQVASELIRVEAVCTARALAPSWNGQSTLPAQPTVEPDGTTARDAAVR
jgi:uncharacterized protein with PIN domain